MKRKLGKNLSIICQGLFGNDYHLETGDKTQFEQCYYFDDLLWDGKGCKIKYDLEMRLCTDNDGDVVLVHAGRECMELYIQ